MSEQINRSYYAVIPANVRYDKNLSNITKLVYAELTAILSEERKITVSLKEISKNLNIPYNNMLKAIVELKDENIIQVENSSLPDYFEICLI